MKIHLDHQAFKSLAQDPSLILSLSSQEPCVLIGWPCLLEVLGLGSILLSLPVFDQTTPLFEATVSTLCSQGEREVVYYVYDQLFAEALRQFQSLPQLNAPFLLQAMREKRHEALEPYQAACEHNPAHFMHDLILYLAWDRMCVWMGRLFDDQRTDPLFLQGLKVLKECLVESNQHLVQDGRTKPGIYRMMEAFFFYEMREENLQHHSPSDWELLSQSFQVITPQDQFPDVPYVDEAVVFNEEQPSSSCVITGDSVELASMRLTFAAWMMEKIAAEYPEWRVRLLSSTSELLTGQNSQSTIVFLHEQK